MNKAINYNDAFYDASNGRYITLTERFCDGKNDLSFDCEEFDENGDRTEYYSQIFRRNELNKFERR